MYVLPFLSYVPALHQQWCRHMAVVMLPDLRTAMAPKTFCSIST